jgi:ElaB/YqjD/DUF883 family membrane-anchored ribosome-binding protein
MSHLTNVPGADKHDDMVAHLRDLAAHLGKDAADAASKAGSALAHAAADVIEQAKKQAGPLAKSAGKEIKEHPVTTAAIVAASVGLIGYALSRQHKA